MASYPLRLFVDRERNRLIVGEASGDFIDVLLSFLTLPLGTIILLLSSEQTHQSPEVGCINNLYRSVQDFKTEVLCNEICKKMLPSPRNPYEKLCQKLRVNVDDTEPTRYLMCGFCGWGSGKWLSTLDGASCSSCGNLMDQEMKVAEEEDNSTKGNGVFVSGKVKYLIFDDLRVLLSSPANTVKQFVQLGYTDVTKLNEVSPIVGFNQIIDLLKRAMVSKSPLTDVFLGQEDCGSSDPMYSLGPLLTPPQFESDSSLKLKITVKKSLNEILYAEAESDFIDFLLSFLTMPLGSILKILDGNITLGSMHNLYESVKGLSSVTVPGLLDLKVASQYGCVRQPLELGEEEIPVYFSEHCDHRGGILYAAKKGNTSNYGWQPMKLFDPRSADGSREAAIGFVSRPSLFVVMEDLQVLPLAPVSSIWFLQKLDIPLDELEVHEVKIGIIEAQKLLGASLTSKTALKILFSTS